MSHVAINRKPVVSSVTLGVFLFIATELMFFTGLISAYLVARGNAMVWPPLGQPRLPVERTAFNTLILLLSAMTLYRSEKSQRYSLFLGRVTLLLGVAFLILQGREWAGLISFGLTSTSSIYGAFFYLIIGAHGLHVLGAVLLRFFVKISAPRPDAIQALNLYWYFVVALWPALYFLVYLL